MSKLFDPGLVYPSDQYGGRYVELKGPVVSVSGFGEIGIRTENHGIVTGWLDDYCKERGFGPKIGQIATIRCYDIGGGWYPDDRVSHWE